MNKLKILKSNLSCTAILSLVMFLCMFCSMIMMPMGIIDLIGYERTEDMEFYSEELADYCLIHFSGNFYKNLCKTFDMENFAGTAKAGYYTVSSHEYYRLNIVSEKMVNELPSFGYNFSKTKPKNYREAYAPTNLKYDFKIGDMIHIDSYEGVYKYKTDVKIIGFTDNKYYSFYDLNTSKDNITSEFLIYDDIPPYANIYGGMMMSDKTPEYYQNLGAEAKTFRQLNESQKYSRSSDSIFYWVICLIILISMAIGANYYFAMDKMTKRSGVMIIYGAKRSTIVKIELIKLVIIFMLAFITSLICMTIMISANPYYYSWMPYFISVGVSLAIYAVSTAFGFVKFAKFKPLKSLSSNE